MHAISKVYYFDYRIRIDLIYEKNIIANRYTIHVHNSHTIFVLLSNMVPLIPGIKSIIHPISMIINIIPLLSYIED